MTHKSPLNSLLGAILFLLAISSLAGCARKGAELFEKEGCMNCHTFKGKGGSMGPDLTAVTNRRSDRWIRRQIKNPMDNDSNSRMPSFDDLSECEIRSIIRYLKG